MPFKTAVLARASQIGLDPAYVYGLIRQESRFIMDASSGVGASGLMQVMPATARWTAKKIGLTDFQPHQINDRDTNIAIGTGYLKLVLDNFDGSMPLAAAAYNAGPGRPRSWRGQAAPGAGGRHLGRERALHRDPRLRQEGADQHHQLRRADHRPAAVAEGPPGAASAPRTPATPEPGWTCPEHQCAGIFHQSPGIATYHHSPTIKVNPMLKLYIGNKNYSSWSMRPWVLLTQAGIAVRRSHGALRLLRRRLRVQEDACRRVTPTGKVPVLVDDDLAVWDTLAIAEYVAEQFPDKQLWPADKAARARARSICAEMHTGFTALRGACPMNIEADLPQAGALIWRDKPACAPMCSAWWRCGARCLQQHGGPMLFGAFTIADAYFAPVCMRLQDLRPAGATGHRGLCGARVRPARRAGLDRRGAGRKGLPGLRRALPPATP